MQAIGNVPRPSQSYPGSQQLDVKPSHTDWMAMYSRKPHGNRTLFELEALVAKRMELLAWIDQLANAPEAKRFDDILDDIGSRLPEERRSRNSTYLQTRGTVLGAVEEAPAASSTRTSVGRRSASRGSTTAYSPAPIVVFDGEEDLLSHLLCRFAFCVSDKWRRWYVKAEETLLRARLKLEMAKDPINFLVDLMKRNGLACAPLSDELTADPVVQEYIAYRGYKAGQTNDSEKRAHNYYSVSTRLTTRLIKSRSVLCRGGKAILFRDQVSEVFVTVFRSQVERSLHEAYLSRVRVQNLEDDSEKATVMSMLDAFLEQFIADPNDGLAEGTEGSVRAGDVQRLAQTHFPLCMRQVDMHLRHEGHLKHTGRFMYGLFLKAIGLSLDDSMSLFATLMTVKGGGSVEAYAKSAYGYNVRHNYGREGKKTSYTSQSCGTIVGQPPVVDRNDCHGCPFRFRDEAAFRQLLQKEQPNPKGKSYPNVRLSVADIEDIVNDSKGQHYTRACYKYFMKTHEGVKRDTLFRSPYEYYCCSREVEADANKEDNFAKGGDGFGTPGRPSAGVKRTDTTPILREDVTRHRQQ